MQFTVTHKTIYKYHDSVSICHNIAWLIPRSTPHQTCNNVEINIHPKPAQMQQYQDYFGNNVLYFAIQQEHTELEVSIKSKITIHPIVTNPTSSTITWEDALLQINQLNYQDIWVQEYIPATSMIVIDDAVKSFAKESFSPGKPILEALQHLTHNIFTQLEFEPGFTTIATPVKEVLEQRKGVCQDFAHLAIACVRSMGLPARYVSGYIETLPPPGKEKLVGVDASHAWFSAYIPGMGWVDFDPTNNVMPSHQHIAIGWGRQYADVPPLKGVILSSGHHNLSVTVDVSRTG